MIKLLLSYNAALNVVTKDGMTALSMAAREGDVSIINHLLASGAYPGFCSAPTLSPVSVAAESGEYVAFRALLNAGGTAQTQDYYALCESGSRSVLMLDERYFGAMQGPDLLHSLDYDCGKWVMPVLRAMPLARRALHFATLHPKKKITALYGAAKEGDVSFLDIALRCGAAINMEGGPEGTPLMAACIAGHTSIVKRLVRCGALLTYWNGSGQVSSFVKANPHPNILRWLLVGRFTETLRLTGTSAGGGVYSSFTESRYDDLHEMNVELVLQHDIDGYFEKNFWFVPARRFVDSGDGSFDAADILPSEFAKYQPTYI